MEAVPAFRATIENAINSSKPYSYFKDHLNLFTDHNFLAILLYYLHENYTSESLNDIKKLIQNEHYEYRVLEYEDFETSLAKNAFTAAIEFWYLDLAETILLDKFPPIMSVSILKLFQKSEIRLLRIILGLEVRVQGIKRSNSPRELVKMVRGLFEENPDGPQKIRACDIIEFGIQQNIAMSTIMKLCVECKDLDDGSALNALLCHGKEEEALVLLGQYGNSINSKSLLQALTKGCLKFAIEFAGKQKSIKGSSSRIFSFLFRKISKQLPDEIGNIEIYLYILRKYVESADLDDAIKYADAVEAILDQEFVEEHFWKFFNPIKIIALLIELTKQFDSQFPSMMMRFQKIVEDLNSLGTDILNDVNVDSIMKFILYDKDIENRDTLEIILENQIIDFLDNSIVEKIANEVWSGPFDFAKNPLPSMSGLYKLITHHKLCGDKDVVAGLRNKLFDRDVENMQTHKVEFEVWRLSAGLRILFIGLEYVALTVGLFTFELLLRNAFNRMDSVKIVAENENRELSPSEYDRYYNAIVDCKIWTFWWDLDAIAILIGASRCFTLPIFCVLTGRGRKWLSLEWLINLVIVLLMLAMYIPFRPDKEILGFEHIMMEGKPLVEKVEQLQDDQYTTILTAIIAFGLGLRILYLLRYTNFLGPLITILVSMIRKSLEFTVFFFIVIFVFSLSATLLFDTAEPGFDSIENILVTLFQSSIGVFDLNPPEKYKLEAKLFYIVFIFIVNIVLLNIIIAILNDIYSQMAPKSQSSLHKDIISLRNQYKPHKYYQFMVSSYFIFDIVICIMFLPVLPFLSKQGKAALNKCLLYVEYAFAFIVIVPFYFIFEIMLIPIAFVAGIINKTTLAWKKRRVPNQIRRALFAISFLIYGIPLLIFCAFMDTVSFTVGSFNHKPPRRLDKEANDYAPADVMKEVIDFLKDFEEEEVPYETVNKGLESIFSKEVNPETLKKVIFKTISNILWIAQFSTVENYIRKKYHNQENHGMINVKNLHTVFSRLLRLHLLRRHVKNEFPGTKNYYSSDINLSATVTPQNRTFSALPDTPRSQSYIDPIEKSENSGQMLVAALKVYDPEVYKSGIEKYVAREAMTSSMAIQVRNTAELVQKLCDHLIPEENASNSHIKTDNEKTKNGTPTLKESLIQKGKEAVEIVNNEFEFFDDPKDEKSKKVKKI